MAACNDWEIDFFNFNGAYLNGKLSEGEEIFMAKPPGYKQGTGSVKWLQKSLYGLKQASRKWYDTLTHTLADFSLHVTQADPGIFCFQEDNTTIILTVYIDDCIITGTSAELIMEYKKKLNVCYTLTDLGLIYWLLRIKITHNRVERTIALSQTFYINTILARFGLTNAKPQQTPMIPNAVYLKDDCPSNPTHTDHMKKVPYHKAIGSLMYAVVATHPDISFEVSTLSQFLENLGEHHWDAVKRVFCYLSGTRNLQLTFGTDHYDLWGYTDADGVSQPHRHTISGYTFMLDGAAVSWRSQKQELVTLSTAEAEYVMATHAAKEAVWLHHVIEELFSISSDPTMLLCNNQAVIKIVINLNDNYRAHTKYINIHYHFIHQVINMGEMAISYYPTENMTADILTKALPVWKVARHIAGLGLQDLTVTLAGECWSILPIGRRYWMPRGKKI
jgi:Reverse transcriptase (RNA-dependent DNA polymerase)